MNNVHFSSQTNEWATPQKMFDQLNTEFGFTLDPCATPQNAKCSKYFTQEDDGLKHSWAGETVFMNPPYGRGIKHWIRKAYIESKQPNTTVVCLIPARTDTSYWHDYCIGGGVRRFAFCAAESNLLVQMGKQIPLHSHQP